MSDTVKYFFDENFAEENKTEETQNIKELKELYNLLSIEDKVVFRRFVINEPLF